jgi:hypothetical protein
MYRSGKNLHLSVNNPDTSLQIVPPIDFTLQSGEIEETTIEHISNLTITIL